MKNTLKVVLADDEALIRLALPALKLLHPEV